MISSGGSRGGFRVILFVLKNAKAEDCIPPVDHIEKRHPNAAAITQAIIEAGLFSKSILSQLLKIVLRKEDCH